jgi:hypothetical protein
MDKVIFSETLVSTYKSIRRYSREDHRYLNLKEKVVLDSGHFSFTLYTGLYYKIFRNFVTESYLKSYL